MARVIILIARPDSGKSRTINKVANKLGLEHSKGTPPFIKWYGSAMDISSQKKIKIYAETSSPQEQKSNLDRDKAIGLMVQYPTLIKRPILDTSQKIILGFDAANYQSEL